MTKAEFAIPFKMLQELRDFVVSDQAYGWWFSCLGQLPADVWGDAVQSFCRDDRTPGKPTPAMVLRFAGVYGLTPEERGDLAWGKVREAARRHTVVQFDDPAVNQAIRNCGGMVAMRSGREDDQHFRKAAFVKAYAACVRGGHGSSKPLDCLPEEHGTPPVLLSCGLPAAHKRLPLATSVACVLEHQPAAGAMIRRS